MNVPASPITGAFNATLVINVETRVTGITTTPTTSNLTMQGAYRPTQTFTATITPTNANVGTNISWISSNTNVATVNSSGIVTPVGPGHTYITARSGNGIYSTPRRVNVTSLVTNLEMCRDNVRLTIDGDVYEQTQLEVTVTPTNASNSNVVWESSDPSVATVDQNGNVTAVFQGTTAITATSTDGTQIFTTSTVTVERLVTDIVLTPVTLQILGDLYSIDSIRSRDSPN